MLKQKISINIPANLKFSSLVRRVSDEVFAFVGFSKEWQARLKLVVDELFMNAVKYGSTQDISIVNIEYVFDTLEVNFTIKDDGTGPKKISSDDLNILIESNKQNSDLSKTSGRGLALISEYWTDSLEFLDNENGGILVKFIKKVDNLPPKHPPIIQLKEDFNNIDVSHLNNIKIEDNIDLTKKIYKVKIQGEVDQSNIENIVMPVTEQIKSIENNSLLIIDFTDIKYINSTFIGKLAFWHNELSKSNSEVLLVGVKKEVKEILDLVGLSTIIKINPNL